MTDGAGGVHLLVRSGGSDPISVHLGPAWFIDSQGFTIRPGDTVEITGSRVVLDGAPILIARTVVRDGNELAVRDEQGWPRWSASSISVCCSLGSWPRWC